MKVLVVAFLLAMGVGSQAMAVPQTMGVETYAGYRDGVVSGILLSTSAIFASDVTANRSQAVYLNADQDAATYLAEGGDPTPQLVQAMAYERNFLARHQVKNSSDLSSEEVAYLVMKRAESL